MKKISILILVYLFINGCGYKIVNKDKAITFNIIKVNTTYNPAITSSMITPKLFLNFSSKKFIGNGFLISKNLNKIKIYI